MKKLVFIFLILAYQSYGQDDLLKEIEQNKKPDTDVTIATFKGTRIINGHSIETKPKHSLEFIFAHRFGRINSGWYEMYGLDQALVRLGLDYGFTDRLSVSIGRNSADKTLDGYLKYRVLQQKSGAETFPFSVTVLGGAAYRFSPERNRDVSDKFTNTDRISYTAQALIARKFTSALSLQIMPTLIHKNYIETGIEENEQFAIGFAGRYKLTKSFALTTEYYHNFNMLSASPYHNSFGLGMDIETGGHVFQLLITNSAGLTERAFITETADDFFDGDIHFGFNVTRTFQLKRGKKE
jgi:hypothetical protein